MSRIPELNDALAKEKDADIMDEIGRYIYKKQQGDQLLSDNDKLLIRNASALMAKDSSNSNFKDYQYTSNKTYDRRGWENTGLKMKFKQIIQA